jgi:hypothetical protein
MLNPTLPNPTSSQEDWDVIDQAGFESFPASDPPGWGSHHAAANPIKALAVPTQPGVLLRLARAFQRYVLHRDATL